MGYQALLFCPEDKLARVVSQVFNELDFTIDPVNEPFAAVKKLMAQRYDAIVVDCDNEQNTALLFKSARNSSLNQGSLAIALVEGQAGVAKAYRIGANLVLTKPINVEQTKGTLRVARGLLRKGVEGGAVAAVSTGVAIKTAPSPAKPSVAPVSAPQPSVAALPSPAVAATTPPNIEEVKLPLPAVAASAKTEDQPATVPTPVMQATIPAIQERPTTFSSPGPTETDRRKEERVKPVVPAPASVAPANSQAAAAAPAPAKEVAPPQEKIVAPPAKIAPPPSDDAVKEEKKAEKQAELPKVSPTLVKERSSDSGISDGPTFAALGVQDSSASGGSKKILIGIVALVFVVALAYFGWTRFGQSRPSATSQPATPAATQPAQQNNAPAQIASMSTPASEPAPATTVGRASTSTAAEHGSKSSAVQGTKPSATATPEITLNTEPEPRKSLETPIHVKPAASTAKAQPQTEEAAVQMPSPLGMTSSSETNLSGVLASTNVSKPTLARIKLSQGISQGLLIKRVAPKYPQAALATHLEGTVQIEATINKEGMVTNPKVIKGDRILAAAALDAVHQWRYKPYYLDGEPVEVETDITINFKAN